MPRSLRVALLGTGLLAVLLACLEGGLRIGGVDLYPRTSILAYQEVFPPALHPDRRPDGQAILRPTDPRIHWQAVPAKKTEGTLRVICFGGSTVVGLGHCPNVTFARQLEDLLVEGYPGRRIEVLNLGVVATAAKQVRILFEDALRHADPDVVIVWCGTNEFLAVHAEKYAARESARYQRALQRLSRSYLYRAVLRAVKGPPSPADLPSRDESADDAERLTQARIIRKITTTPAECAATMAAYQRELEGMVAAARAAAVPFLLCGEAVNDEWVGREGLPCDWMSALPGSPSTPEAALEALDALLARPDLGPLERWEALARRATAKDLVGDVAGANRDWREACNIDPHQRRSSDAHIAAVRAAAVGDGVMFFDAIGALAADNARGRVGFDYFYDYVHFTPRGAVVVATAMYDALQRLAGVPRASAPLARAEGSLPRSLAARLARIAEARVDFVDTREFVGFCFEPLELVSTDLWKYDRAVRGLDARIAAEPEDWRALAFRGNAASYSSVLGAGDAAQRDWTRALTLCDDPASAEALRANLARLAEWRAPDR